MAGGNKLVLVDGPFEGFTGVTVNIPLPEHLRVYFVPREGATAKPELPGFDWPERAARYTLIQSVKTPATYGYDGVGDGGEKPSEWTAAPKPVHVGGEPIHAGPAYAPSGDPEFMPLGRWITFKRELSDADYLRMLGDDDAEG